MRELKQRVLDCNAQDWHDKIATKGRFENNIGFKQILELESCLSDLTVKIDRDAIVRVPSGDIEFVCSKYRNNPTRIRFVGR